MIMTNMIIAINYYSILRTLAIPNHADNKHKIDFCPRIAQTKT